MKTVATADTGVAVTMPASAVSRMIACLRAAAFLISAIVILLILVPMLALGRETAAVRKAYFRFIARVLGLRLVVTGKPMDQRPALFVCNHISYLDIVALGGVVEGEFVSRADVADWPLFGVMAKASSTVFIDRRWRATHHARDLMQDRIRQHRALIMFPESTSGNGNHLLPFKSSLFNVAESEVSGGKVIVQPVSLAYTRTNGMPIGIGWRPLWAWYGDMTLVPHLWSMLQMGRTTIEVAFHNPVSADAFADRKALAAHCQSIIGRGFARLLSGRSAA